MTVRLLDQRVPSAKRLPLKRGSTADAPLIAAPRSTKNAQGKHDPEMQVVRST